MYNFKDEMIRRLLNKNGYFAFRKTPNLLLSYTKQIISMSSYHSESIDGNIPEEVSFDEQRLSSQEATQILRAHEASIDLEADCPVKYYEVNYLGANNPPGMSSIY